MVFVNIVGGTKSCHSIYKVVTFVVCLEQRVLICVHFGGKS